MDAIECMKTRRSIRKYLDVPVEWDKVSDILDCGRLAPSAGNLQNWKFIVITDNEEKLPIAEACVQQLWIAKAPVIIILVSEPDKCKRFYGMRGERLYTIQNCAAAAQNMLNAAHGLGLGGCWIGAFDEDMLKRALGMPEEVRPQIVLTIGYPDEKVPKPRKFPLEVIAYRRKWRGRVYDGDKAMGWHSPKTEKVIHTGINLVKTAPDKVRAHAKKLSDKIKKKLKEKKNP